MGWGHGKGERASGRVSGRVLGKASTCARKGERASGRKGVWKEKASGGRPEGTTGVQKQQGRGWVDKEALSGRCLEESKRKMEKCSLRRALCAENGVPWRPGGASAGATGTVRCASARRTRGCAACAPAMRGSGSVRLETHSSLVSTAVPDFKASAIALMPEAS